MEAPYFNLSVCKNSFKPNELKRFTSPSGCLLTACKLEPASGPNHMYENIAASLVVLVMTLVMSLSGCALHKDLVALDDEVIAFEQKSEADMALLRSKVKLYHEDQLKSDQDSRNRHAELRALINDLRDEMSQLRGGVEKGRYDTQKRMEDLAETHQKNMEKSLQNNHDRIVRIEQYLGMEPSEKLGAPGIDQDKGKKEKPEAQETSEGLYAKAKQSFDKGEYENARELFRSFLEQYPKSKKGDNAQFWLGEIYYREKWYEKAILEYQKVIEGYPKGNKTPSALLKQGFAFLNLDDKANARLILKELIRKYPDSNEANIAKNKLKTLK